jgi:hypothetical protein
MDLAVQTTASTAEIWVIVIVMSIVTAILCAAPAWGDWLQQRAASAQRARRDSQVQVQAGEAQAGGVTVPPPRGAQRDEAELPYAGSGAKREGEPGR